MKKKLIFLQVFVLFTCLINIGSAQIPKDYKGKPFKDKYYTQGAQAIPGRVELAYYDLGGEGIAYHDNSPENEGSKFWLNNFTEMKNRGLKDILIACSDNLSGMSEAISAVYPATEHQLCIVHQIRNSLSYVSYKDRKELDLIAMCQTY